ncbi:MAG: hypothetical protein M5U28_44485 [Sandaracinaceae bacterium]|nr:hypothetical protein [Sandaracinaceae bacterium]
MTATASCTTVATALATPAPAVPMEAAPSSGRPRRASPASPNTSTQVSGRFTAFAAITPMTSGSVTEWACKKARAAASQRNGSSPGRRA